MNRKSSPVRSFILTTLLAARLLQAEAREEFPAESLRIVAVIDGTDVLHLSRTEARWVHESWSWPRDVSINGHSWNPEQQQIWTRSPNAAIVREDLDFSGAVVHVLRGRGSVVCSRSGAELQIRFDDPESGSDTYEVAMDFAQALVRKPAAAVDLRLRVAAKIDGTDEAWLSATGLEWRHTSWELPEMVTVNDQRWDVGKSPTFPFDMDPVLGTDPKMVKGPPLPNPLLPRRRGSVTRDLEGSGVENAVASLPETLDLQRATIKKERGRGLVSLDCRPEALALGFENYDPATARDFRTAFESLCINFEDPQDGADWYSATVTVPRFRQRQLVRLVARGCPGISGAVLKIYHFPASSEARTVLAGQRFFGPEGDCLAAIEPGQYQFEALNLGPVGPVVLKTGIIQITGPTNIDLQAHEFEIGLADPGDAFIPIDELSVRSARPGGAVQCKPPAGRVATTLKAVLSIGQAYHVRTFGHSGTNYYALWTPVSAGDGAEIRLRTDKWFERSFFWQQGTPHPTSRGVVLDFPDARLEIPNADRARFFTNRRFFTAGYWLDFPGNRKAVFEPRPCLAGEPVSEMVLGGPLRPLASAAVLQDENLGRPDALRLWYDLTLADSQGYLLDTAASKIGWKPELKWATGAALPPAPLPQDFELQLVNIQRQLVASAVYQLDAAGKCSIGPEPLVETRLGRFTARVPPYRVWNTTCYLSKAERELGFIFLVRSARDEPDRRFQIKWWLNNGAVGGGNSITMPVSGYLQCLDWYSHPWSLAHETMHNLGYGHTHELNRLDEAVQERMEFFRWRAADDPGYQPAGMLSQ